MKSPRSEVLPSEGSGSATSEGEDSIARHLARLKDKLRGPGLFPSEIHHPLPKLGQSGVRNLGSDHP